MKKKIIIHGSRVHDVGYRLTLCKYAQKFRIFYFEAVNENTETEEQVVVYLEGDEQSLSEFIAYIHKNQPPSSIVSAITHEDYHGEILPLSVFSQSLQMEQMSKAVPILVEMRDMQQMALDLHKTSISMHQTSIDLQKETIGLQHETLNKQDEMIDEMKLMRENVVTVIKLRLDNVEHTIADMKRAFETLGVHL